MTKNIYIYENLQNWMISLSEHVPKKKQSINFCDILFGLNFLWTRIYTVTLMSELFPHVSFHV